MIGGLTMKIARKKDVPFIAGTVAVVGFGAWLVHGMIYDRDHPPWYQHITYDETEAALNCKSNEHCERTLDVLLQGCKSKYGPDPDQVYGCQYDYMKELGLVDHPTPPDKP